MISLKTFYIHPKIHHQEL